MAPIGPLVRAASSLAVLPTVPPPVGAQAPAASREDGQAFGGHLPAQSIRRLVAYLRSLEPAVDTLSTTAW